MSSDVSLKPFLVITLSLVLLFGAAGTLALFLSRPSHGPIANDVEAERAPASLSMTTQPVRASVRSAPTMAQLDLSCLKNSKESLVTLSKQVRLNGEDCENGTVKKDYAIKNETNGYSATVFSSKGRNFTTDYIELEPGENKIAFKLTSKDGEQKDYRVSIVRVR